MGSRLPLSGGASARRRATAAANFGEDAFALELRLGVVVGIVGAGALGTIFAQGLREVGDVRVVSRSGISPLGLADADVVLVMVKTYDTVAALEPLRGLLGPRTAIVSLQNGIEQVAQIVAALGAGHPIAIAPTTEAATRERDGTARRIGRGKTTLGWTVQHPGAFQVDALATMLTEAGFGAEVVAPIEPHVWGKLVVSAAINPVTALARRPNGYVVENASAGALAAALAREAAAVATALGFALPFDDPVAHVLEIARATGENRSSMLQDLERGRPTEIDAINGAIVRRGLALGLATPENARIADEVRRIAKA